MPAPGSALGTAAADPAPASAPAPAPAPASPPPEAADRGLCAALHHHFGFPAFRETQETIIRDILAGRSTLGVLPTSGGKSLCYQLPAVLLPGVTVVVSPLIALMKDQVDALRRRNIPAAALTSHLEPPAQRDTLQALREGALRLVYVAPERLLNPEFLAAVGGVTVSLLAVDEAHCVSQWGHDFRPDYRLVPLFHRRIGAPPVLALTATAPPAVRRDILRELGIENAVVGPFDRPNLRYGVAAVRKEEEQRREVVAWLRRLDRGCVIIYTATRRAAEQWATALARGPAAGAGPFAVYHAGLTAAERRRVQDDFMAGEVRVIVATCAFGMGIDKPDIRGVLHLGLPDSVETYVQEVGRAGRDGEPAWGVVISLLSRDAVLKKRLLEKQRPQAAWLERSLRRVAESAKRGGPLDLAGDEEGLGQALLLLPHLLEYGLVAEPRTRGAVRALRVRCAPTGDEAGAIMEAIRRQYANKMARFETLQTYLTAQSCRRDFLARYFGMPLAESKPEVCCDHCHRSAFAAPAKTDPAPEETRLPVPPEALGQPPRSERAFGPPADRTDLVVAALDCTVEVAGRTDKSGARQVRVLLWKGDGSLSLHDHSSVRPSFYLRQVRRHELVGPGRFTATDGEDRLTLNIYAWLWVKTLGGPSVTAASRRPERAAAGEGVKPTCRALLQNCANAHCPHHRATGHGYHFHGGERECPHCRAARRTCSRRAAGEDGFCAYHGKFAPRETVDPGRTD